MWSLAHDPAATLVMQPRTAIRLQLAARLLHVLPLQSLWTLLLVFGLLATHSEAGLLPVLLMVATHEARRATRDWPGLFDGSDNADD